MPTEVAQALPAVPIVVVVDDDPAVCSSLKFSLELEGFSVRTYGSAAEFLKVGLENANCLIVDQRMPAMTGIELIAKLRATNISTPAILIVSQPNVAINARAARMGASVVEKPFLGNGLVKEIRQACRPKAE